MAKTANGKPGKSPAKGVYGAPKGNQYAKGHGPPIGNRNAMRHGLRGGMLPKDSRYIEHRLNAFRRTLEDAVLACRGQVTLPDAAAIQTCLRWERHSALAQRWLRIEGANLKPETKLHFSREIARASTERDKALAALKLDAKPEVLTLETYLEGNGKQ